MTPEEIAAAAKAAQEAAAAKAAQEAAAAAAAKTAREAEAVAVKAAEDALAQAKAAKATLDTQAAAAVGKEAEWAARIAALEAKLATQSQAVAPEGLDEVKRFMVRERNDRRLATIRTMGLDVKLSDEQVLLLIPDVDPREADGLTKFEAWRKANDVLFKSPGQTPQSIVAAAAPRLDALAKKSELFSGARAAAALARGLKGRNV